ncbi:MAG TPA: alpha/beta hydrolase [Solirubrobacteraceae bacterium]
MPPALPPVDGVTHREVDLPEVRLHVAEAGAGDPVLLLHGWPQHWWEWRFVIPALAGECRLIAPDHRGFGWSGTPGFGYDPATFAADAVGLLDALEIERAHVIGHDWGGFTGLLMGLDHPDRVRSLTLASTPHAWLPRSPAALKNVWRIWYALLMATPGLGELLVRQRRFARAMAVGAEDVLTPDVAEVYAAVLREPARARATSLLYRSYLKTAAASLRGDRFAGRRLTVPTRLLSGGADLAIPPDWVLGLEAHADDGRSEIVPGASHWLPESHPDLIVARARELFART